MVILPVGPVPGRLDAPREIPGQKRLVDKLHAVVIMTAAQGDGQAAPNVLDGLGHPLVRTVQQGAFLSPPRIRAGPGQRLAKLPGCGSSVARYRVKGLPPPARPSSARSECTGTWERRDAPAARVVLTLPSSSAFRAGASIRSIWAPFILTSRALRASVIPSSGALEETGKSIIPHIMAARSCGNFVSDRRAARGLPRSGLTPR